MLLASGLKLDTAPIAGVPLSPSAFNIAPSACPRIVKTSFLLTLIAGSFSLDVNAFSPSTIKVTFPLNSILPPVAPFSIYVLPLVNFATPSRNITSSCPHIPCAAANKNNKSNKIACCFPFPLYLYMIYFFIGSLKKDSWPVVSGSVGEYSFVMSGLGSRLAGFSVDGLGRVEQGQ